jgi:hypothetical protein
MVHDAIIDDLTDYLFVPLLALFDLPMLADKRDKSRQVAEPTNQGE